VADPDSPERVHDWCHLGCADNGLDFGFGHYVDGKSWATLLKDYDITDWRVWSLILIWIAVAPVVMRQLHGRPSAGRYALQVLGRKRLSDGSERWILQSTGRLAPSRRRESAALVYVGVTDPTS
jgi:hypothetical protein